ncbi:MAG: peroxiredoxin [Microthrixaceae bacterium]
MLNTGDTAPDFTLQDQTGAEVSLGGLLAGGAVVLFFYPKAMTTGCTKESCHFRDLAAEFAQVGAQRVGISADKVDKQAAFDAKHDLGYPLLSDPSRTVASAFGVKRPGPIMNKRATFVIDTDRRILAAISSELNMDLHADEALTVLRARTSG